MQSLIAMGFIKTWRNGFSYRDCGVIWEKYRERFVKHRLMPMVQKKGGVFPHEDKTRAVQEFLLRGFVHQDTFVRESNKHYVLCNIAPLIWPKGFEHHQDAIKVQGEFGIPGYTSTTLIKY